MGADLRLPGGRARRLLLSAPLAGQMMATMLPSPKPPRRLIRLLRVALLALLCLAPVGCKELLTGMSLGTKLEFNQGELYYTKAVDEAAAKRLGQFLVDEKYFDGTRKTVQLDKAGGIWLLRMVVKAGMDQDEDYANLVKLFGMQVSNGVFSSEALMVELCDERMKTLRSVKPLEGKRLEIHGGEIYYASSVDEASAKRLGEHFVKTGFFDGKHKTLHFLKQDERWVVRIVVRAGMDKNEQAIRDFEVMGLELSGHVFDGGKVVLHLCDDKLVTLKEVDCPDGKRQVFNGGELYFATGVEPAKAKKLGEHLVEEGFFDGAPKTVRVAKSKKGWVFQMVVKPGVEDDVQFVALIEAMAKQLSERIFDGEQVEVHLCDATMHARKVVKP